MKTKMPLKEARAIAEELVERLRIACDRIQIAGSIRRQKAEVGDIDLVVIPRIITISDMFDQPISQHSMLDDLLLRANLGRAIKDGPNCKQIDMGTIMLDLYITTWEQWGIVFTIRTGSVEFNKWLVTKKREGGACPSFMRIEEGRLWAGDQVVETPEESDVFERMGVCWVAPEERER